MLLRHALHLTIALWAVLLAPACTRRVSSDDRPSSSSAAKTAPSADAANAAPSAQPDLVLEVTFSSEKKDWADEAIRAFNESGAKTDGGRAIRVKASYAGSVEPVDDIIAGKSKPHVFSPASSLVLPLLNDAWTGAKGATAKPIVSGADPLVLSPIVVAMWEPMARALGWPAKKLGWGDIAQLAKSPDGWRAKGHAEWGDFRFGHTHPGYSNSGLIAVLAETYAAVGKTRDLEPSDATSPKTKAFVHDIEGAVVHYGRSTGFFYDVLAQHGPGYLSSAILYENLVVASAGNAGLPFPLVCIYPREGTQWADHPFAVLDAPWVGPAEKDAAAKLKAHLTSRAVQERAMQKYGFRPALTDIPLGAPIDAAHGADVKEPQTLLGTPSVRTLRAVLSTWNETKRGVSVIAVVDRSGSMQGSRIRGARDGLVAFLGALRPDDRVSLMTFNAKLDPITPPAPPAEVVPRVQSIFADGGTALYDAILAARDAAEARLASDKKRIHAVVVLTDGEDTNSSIKLPELLEKLRPVEQGDAVRIFTIGYGNEADAKILTSIAKRAGGAYYHGDESNIKAVYDEIASFF